MPLTQIPTGMFEDNSVTAAKLSADLRNQTPAFKNRIINGDMRIDQRNAGASVTPANSAYTLDRWQTVALQASKFTIQRNAGSLSAADRPAGFSNYLGVTSSSAYSILTGDTFAVLQPIEGFNGADLAWGTASASPVTLSFWVRSSLTGVFGGSLYSGARNYIFTYSISSANTWEYKTVTIAGDTSGTWDIGNGLFTQVRFGLGSGASYSGTAGSWGTSNLVQPTGNTSVVGTNGATFYITGVQLEKGSTATSFDYRPYGTELQLCQRYYHKPNFSDTSSSATPYVLLQCSGATELLGPYMLPVTMRSTPTLTYSGLIATKNNNTSAGSLTSLTLDSASTQSFRLVAGVSSGLVAGNASFIQRAATSDYMAFSAEL